MIKTRLMQYHERASKTKSVIPALMRGIVWQDKTMGCVNEGLMATEGEIEETEIRNTAKIAEQAQIWFSVQWEKTIKDIGVPRRLQSREVELGNGETKKAKQLMEILNRKSLKEIVPKWGPTNTIATLANKTPRVFLTHNPPH